MEAYTHYTLVSADADGLVVKGKIKFNDGYVDDQSLSLKQAGSECSVHACSVSESLSSFDYSANYCNVHNLARGLGYNFTETLGACRYHPKEKERDAYCDKQ